MVMSYRSEFELDLNDRKRDARFQVDKVLDAVGIQPGMTVGEVGAGTGYLVFKLASRVGPSGAVVAEDIGASVLETLSQRARRRGIANIETLLGTADDPKLSPGRFDMVFMHATIHFIDKPVEMFNAILGSLKPGGKVVIIEGETPNAIDLDGNPVGAGYYPTRDGYLEMFAKTRLKVERVDDTIVPHKTLFILSKK